MAEPPGSDSGDVHEPGEEVAPSRAGGGIKGYMLPSFSSVLPEYSNVTHDDIVQAFRTGNHKDLRKLPANLTAEEIISAKMRVMEEARSRTEKPRGRPAKSLNGQFMEFEYVPSRYDLADELRTKARLEDEAKRQQIGGGTDFRYPGAKAAAKYEDPFAPDPASEVGTYRYMPDPYDAAKEVERRQRWLREADDLREPFKPTGRVAEPTPSRADLPSIIRAYHALLVRDWEDARFSVIATEDDHIVLRFEEESLDSRKGLRAYMNRLALSGELPAKHSLRRAAEDWDSAPGDGHVYFVFRPPWVRLRPADAFLSKEAAAAAREEGKKEEEEKAGGRGD